MRTIPTLLACLLPACLAAAEEPPAAGDPTRVRAVLPFEAALEEARASGRLLFVKPIYGGVDAAGARDYRCGSW